MEGEPAIERYTAVYIVISPTARTDASWPPRGYAGPSGRLDVLARAALAALTIEPEALFAGVLLGPPRPPITLLLDQGCLAPSERGVMEVFRSLLLGRRRGSCTALPWSAERLLHQARRAGFRLYVLSEGGVDIAEVPGVLDRGAAFLAGAHLDPPTDVVRAARGLGAVEVSVGPLSLLTSHVLAYLATLRRVAGASWPSLFKSSPP